MSIIVLTPEREKAIQAAVDELRLEAADFKIESNEEFLITTERLKKLSNYKKRLKEVTDELLTPFKETIEQVRIVKNKMASFEAIVKDLDGIYRTKANNWVNLQNEIARKKAEEDMRKAREDAEKRAEELRKKAEEEAKKSGKDAEQVLEDIKATEPQQVIAPTEKPVFKSKSELGSSHTVSAWEVIVDDITKVPAEYLIVDKTKIIAAARSGVREISGITLKQVQKIAIRS